MLKIASGSSGVVHSCWNCFTTWVRVAGMGLSCLRGESLAESYKRSLQKESEIVAAPLRLTPLSKSLFCGVDIAPSNLLIRKVLFLTECHSDISRFFTMDMRTIHVHE